MRQGDTRTSDGDVKLVREVEIDRSMGLGAGEFAFQQPWRTQDLWVGTDGLSGRVGRELGLT